MIERLGVPLGSLDGPRPELSPGFVTHLGRPFPEVHDCKPLRPTRLLGDGFTAVPTVVEVRRDDLRAVRAGLPLFRRSVFRVDHPSVREEVLVVLLTGDVLVGLPHVRVDGPVDAGLYLGAFEPLADHPRDRRVAEVVRVDRLVDATVVGSPPEDVVNRRPRNRPISVLVPGVAVAGEFVEEGDVILLWSGVGLSQVIPQWCLRVDDRIGPDISALEPGGVGIRRIRRRLRIEDVQVADAERPRHRESRGRIGEEFHEGNITEVVRAVAQRLDVFSSQDIAWRDVAVGILDGFVVVCPLGPVDVGELKIVPDGVLDGSDRPVGHPTLATAVLLISPEVPHVVVHLVLGEVADCAVDPLTREADVPQVRRQRRFLDGPVEIPDESLDVALVFLRVVVDTLQFEFEVVSELAEVVEWHDTTHEVSDYQTGANKHIMNLHLGWTETAGGTLTLFDAADERVHIPPCVCVFGFRRGGLPLTSGERETAGRKRVSEYTHDQTAFLSSGPVTHTTTTRIQYNYIQQRKGAKNYDTYTNNSEVVA